MVLIIPCGPTNTVVALKGDTQGDVAPNLAVEVLSRSNTPQEMRQKLREYFTMGTELVWFVDPRDRTVQVFKAANKSQQLSAAQPLTGGHVLPGFKVTLKKLFSVLDS